MCSIGEEDFGDDGGLHAMPLQNTEHLLSAITAGCCHKCKETGTVYKLSYRQPECRDCFVSYARHKFRAALGSSKVMPRGAEVLLLIDGTPESLVLLDMLHYAQTQNMHKRLHCHTRVLYIDESELSHSTACNEAEKLWQFFQDACTKYTHFDFYVVPVGIEEQNLASALQKLTNTGIGFAQRTSSDFATKVQQLPTETSRQDYLQQWRKRLLGHVAAHLHCGFIFIASFSTTLATQLLTSIALGRGGSAALDVSLLDDRFLSGVNLVRPLKNLTKAEVDLYVHAQQLKPFVDMHCSSDTASLQSVTAAFMATLQRDYPATVSAVYRIGDKIAPRQSAASAEFPTVCKFCQSSIDCVDSTTLLATEFSRLVSELGTTLDKRVDLEQYALERLHEQRYCQLCHGCRNLQKDLSKNHELLN